MEFEGPDSQKKFSRLSDWSWQSFCKTQYAGNAECGGGENFLRCHLAVIRVLDQAKSLGIMEDVSDEGDFWQNRDVRALAEEVGQWNESDSFARSPDWRYFA